MASEALRPEQPQQDPWQVRPQAISVQLLPWSGACQPLSTTTVGVGKAAHLPSGWLLVDPTESCPMYAARHDLLVYYMSHAWSPPVVNTFGMNRRDLLRRPHVSLSSPRRARLGPRHLRNHCALNGMA
jgi:hypothetical protein